MTNKKLLRLAYAQGLFPMAENQHAEAEIDWYKPVRDRAVFRPESFHVPRRLARLLRNCPFELRWNDDVRAVMTACRDVRETSWINAPLIDLFTAWEDVYCLSVFQDGKRVGGLYGVRLGALCTAESMFSLVPNASSVALAVLMAGLAKAGVSVLDAQIANPHTMRFHPELWTDAQYQKALQTLVPVPIELKADYFCLEVANSFVQSLSHTS